VAAGEPGASVVEIALGADLMPLLHRTGTCAVARNIGLIPCKTPVSGPQSNGMAEAFIRTLKRDYAPLSPGPDAKPILDQLPGRFNHPNEVHPHRYCAIDHPASSASKPRGSSVL
jgi:transposase InsO family protein